ncbi:MAG: iron-containing alcohol dehydrogenase [Clostridia bacterium]|nr:iron-containing alcohol dehydrogenase [Clostridia bacterium]
MNQFILNSYMPAKIISGHDCVKKNAAVFKGFGNKCLLVTGASGAKKSGALDDVINTLVACDISYVIFDSVSQNPLAEECRLAGLLAVKENVDFIVGIGGGSALDASKAVAIFAANPTFTVSDLYNRAIPANRLPLVLIGTTAGTGSEVTGVSVLTDMKGFKKSISGADCYADVSFCDAKYTHSASYDVTVSTALDAYAHALESFFAETSNDLSALYAEKALKLLWKNLNILRTNKKQPISDLQRNELYVASLYAGLAINITGTAFPHTAGYILTEIYNVPHGKACTAFHPQLMDKAEKYRPEKLEAVCAWFDTNKDGINEVIRDLTALTIHITDEQAKEYCSRWTSSVKNFDRTPGGYTPDEAVVGLLAFRETE